MKNAITTTPFQFQSREVRALTIDDAHWFVAKDVCDILGINDPSMAVRDLDEDEKGTSTIGTPGGNQNMLTVNESGLYALIFKSRKPEAKAFRKWVTAVVLPTLRKTGQFRITNPNTPGRPGPEWITAKEAAAQWNIPYRSARYHLARMAKNGEAEVVATRNPKIPKYYRPVENTPTNTSTAEPTTTYTATPFRHFRARTTPDGRMTLEEYSPVIMMHDIALWLADPAATFQGSTGPDDDRNRLLEIARVAAMRATLGPKETWNQLYGNAH